MRFNLFNFTRHYKLHGVENGVLEELRLLKEEMKSMKRVNEPSIDEAIASTSGQNAQMPTQNTNSTINVLNESIKKVLLFLICGIEKYLILFVFR